MKAAAGTEPSSELRMLRRRSFSNRTGGESRNRRDDMEVRARREKGKVGMRTALATLDTCGINSN